MAKGKDYYNLLGVKKEATEAEIKSAYKKAALKHHPDRGGNADKFKEISEAYEALSDPQKRSIYDQFGEEGLKGTGPMPGPGGGGPPGGNPFGGGGGFSGFPGGTTFSFTSAGGPSPFGNFGPSASGFVPSDPNDIFSRFFTNSHGGGPPGGFGGMDIDDDAEDFLRSRTKRRAGPRQPETESDKPLPEVKKPLQVTLEEMYSGAVKKLKITRKLADGTSEPKILEVTIKPGYKAGTKITYKGAGNEELSSDGRLRSQDIVFIVEEKPHEKFKRDGDDLVYTMKVSLADALCGPTDPALSRRSLTTLDGRTLTVSLPFPDPSRGGTPLAPGHQVKVPKEGFPISKAGAGKAKGDLIVKAEVQFPTKISPSQASSLRSILASTT